MPIVPKSWVSTEEISNRIDRLQVAYAGNPLVKHIGYRIGVDWSDDPAVFIDVTVAPGQAATVELQQLADKIRVDLLRLVRTDELGLHSYLNFMS